MSNTGGTLHIVNHFAEAVSVYVTSNSWNCCDIPQPNTPVGFVRPGGSVDLNYVKTSGHGCDGKQGQFELSFNISMLVDLHLDSNAAMAPPTPSGCNAAMSQDPDGTYRLIVYSS